MENNQFDFIDRKVDEILKELRCKTVAEASAKLDILMSKKNSHSQMHLNAFSNNQSEVE